MKHLNEGQKTALLGRAAGNLYAIRRWAQRVGVNMPVEMQGAIEDICLALTAPEARALFHCRVCGQHTCGFTSAEGEVWKMCDACGEEMQDDLHHERQYEMRDDAQAEEDKK